MIMTDFKDVVPKEATVVRYEYTRMADNFTVGIKMAIKGNVNLILSTHCLNTGFFSHFS